MELFFVYMNIRELQMSCLISELGISKALTETLCKNKVRIVKDVGNIFAVKHFMVNIRKFAATHNKHYTGNNLNSSNTSTSSCSQAKTVSYLWEITIFAKIQVGSDCK